MCSSLTLMDAPMGERAEGTEIWKAAPGRRGGGGARARAKVSAFRARCSVLCTRYNPWTQAGARRVEACLLPTPPLQPRRGQKTGPLSPGPRRQRRLSAPTDAVTLLPGGGDPGFTGRGRSGAPPPTPLPAFSPHSPPPGPEPRAPRLGTGRGGGGEGGQGCRSSPPLLLRPLERFVKLPIPPAARSSSSSSSSFTTSSSSASSSPRAPPSPRLPRPPSFFPPHVRGSRRSAERGGRGEPGRSSILRAAALRGGG
ncbi:translation initiation factor IF-2-like [Bubalus bubalis]|uniref:translation initiation factor IF-2-like n=1 Tax=Bubalus bubalis TaxID=89462 RepID=UPI001E1B891A|nr:translation initiation factor IF-2-like [Bubalus bubalis]